MSVHNRNEHTRPNIGESVFTRIKHVLPERVKKPIRSLRTYMRVTGQIPRDAIGAMRNRNMVFLWIPKTAGTSLYTALDSHICTKILDLSSAKRRFRNKGLVTFGHMDYRELVRSGLVEPQFDDSAFKFCFSRNPYSRAVSLYFFSLKRHWITDDLSFLGFCRLIDKGVQDIGLFNVRELSQCNPQVRWLRGVSPDFIGRLENFDSDVHRLFDLLGLDAPSVSTAKNRTAHSPYREYYCTESSEIVSRVYAEDFERFGYSVTL
ncbi:MAG: sulfotransferase family 2 domain-containing protein [Gammaproteobacteria bacterium]